MNTIHINNRKFDLELIDEKLKNQVPGKYKICIHTRYSVWECTVKWDGRDWKDLHTQN